MEKDFNFFAEYNRNSRMAKILKVFNIKRIVLPILIILMIGVTGMQYFYIQNEKARLEQEVDEKESELASLQEELIYVNETGGIEMPEIPTGNEEVNQLRELKALAEIYDANIDYRVLLGINNSLPEGVFVESIILSNPNDSISSVITGYSLTNNYIADFQNNLRNNGRFNNMYIDKITYAEDRGYAFSLFFNIIDTENEIAEEETGNEF